VNDSSEPTGNMLVLGAQSARCGTQYTEHRKLTPRNSLPAAKEGGTTKMKAKVVLDLHRQALKNQIL
jgi:hypothetical protein